MLLPRLGYKTLIYILGSLELSHALAHSLHLLWCHEQPALWRDLHGEELKPPSSRHIGELKR